MHPIPDTEVLLSVDESHAILDNSILIWGTATDMVSFSFANGIWLTSWL